MSRLKLGYTAILGPWAVGENVYFVHSSRRELGGNPDICEEFNAATVLGTVTQLFPDTAHVKIDGTEDTILVHTYTFRPREGYGYSSFFVIPYRVVLAQSEALPTRTHAHLTARDVLAIDNIISDVEDQRVSVEAATAYAAALIESKLRRVQRDSALTPVKSQKEL